MEKKLWLNSTTVRGVLIALMPTIVVILNFAGVDLGSEEQQSLIDGVVGVVGLIGAVVAIIGRFNAHKTEVTLK